MTRAELIASLRAEAHSLRPQSEEMSTRRKELEDRLTQLGREQGKLLQRVSDLLKAADAIEALGKDVEVPR